MRRTLLILATALGLAVPAGAAGAAETGIALPARAWSFDGIFGTYDRAAAQRGFQVYKDVCAACHSLKLIHFRNLEGLGFGSVRLDATRFLRNPEHFTDFHIADVAPYARRYHIDVVATRFDIWVDDRQIMADGKFLIE